jgi:hypothetical protein
MTSGLGSRRRTEWLAYVLAGLPGALLAIVGATGLVPERLAVLAFAPSFVGLNLVHMAGTWSRAYLGRNGWRHAPIERGVIPALVVLGSIGLEAAGATVALIGAQYYLSIHHGLMQNYGILRSTQRRAGRAIPARALRLDQAACLLMPLAALVHRARSVCHTYEGLPLARPPEWIAPALGVAGAVALFAFVARETRAHMRGEEVDPMGIALVLSTNALWSGLLLAVEHPLLPLYAIASGHYVQQIYFVWRSSAASGALERVPAFARAFVAPPARVGFLVGLGALGGVVLLALTGLSAGAQWLAQAVGLRSLAEPPIAPWLAALIGVNLSHYWLESRIWRAPTVRPAPPIGGAPA